MRWNWDGVGVGGSAVPTNDVKNTIGSFQIHLLLLFLFFPSSCIRIHNKFIFFWTGLNILFGLATSAMKRSAQVFHNIFQFRDAGSPSSICIHGILVHIDAESSPSPSSFPSQFYIFSIFRVDCFLCELHNLLSLSATDKRLSNLRKKLHSSKRDCDCLGGLFKNSCLNGVCTVG